MTIHVDSLADLPRVGGAYALAIDLQRAIPAPGSRADARGATTIGPGHYVYAGNARGRGGIRPRVLRHARRL